MASARFRLPHTAILVVDMQEKLVGHMHNSDAIIQRVGLLLDGGVALGVPVFATEQYPQGLGPTLPGLMTKMPAEAVAHPKKRFSALIDPVREGLAGVYARAVLVCGVEAHVCVLQTCLDLIDRGFVVGLVTDAIGSRREPDHHTAVQRMVQAGVLPTTTESALLELAVEAGSPQFSSILPLIK